MSKSKVAKERLSKFGEMLAYYAADPDAIKDVAFGGLLDHCEWLHAFPPPGVRDFKYMYEQTQAMMRSFGVEPSPEEKAVVLSNWIDITSASMIRGYIEAMEAWDLWDQIFTEYFDLFVAGSGEFTPAYFENVNALCRYVGKPEIERDDPRVIKAISETLRGNWDSRWAPWSSYDEAYNMLSRHFGKNVIEEAIKIAKATDVRRRQFQPHLYR